MSGDAEELVGAGAEVATRPTLPAAVLESGVIAVLRAPAASEYLAVCRTLVAAGVVGLELTLTTPGTFGVLPELRVALPGAVIGVGTVTRVEEVEQALAAGASFIVTPVTQGAVIDAAVRAGVAVVPGGMTPTELHEGWTQGAAAVKVFPASAVGSGYLAQLAGPFPELRAMPSGGVALDDIGAWIAAGAVAVSLGGPLLGDAFAGGDLAALAARAERALHAVAAARHP
ncbi:2-dehydro-3-deoxyphosphogluconate aldolase [Clavibacter michiganensis]|nr:2-dehydro-3-deoxyphosphogluconate aldolase [Clavibacter michiganensis]